MRRTSRSSERRERKRLMGWPDGPASDSLSFGKNMDTSRILKVAVLEDGRTAVFPESRKAMYQYVYREAAGVYWEQESGCFVSTPPGDWTPQQWYQHIVTIVKTGVGLQMVLTPETEYDSKQEDFEESIKVADRDLWQ